MAYIEDQVPNWDELSKLHGEDRFSLILLDKPDVPLDGMEFDYGALRGSLTEVLAIREFAPESSAFGYVFARTPEDRQGELWNILRSDLTEFLRPA